MVMVIIMVMGSEKLRALKTQHTQHAYQLSITQLNITCRCCCYPYCGLAACTLCTHVCVRMSFRTHRHTHAHTYEHMHAHKDTHVRTHAHTHARTYSHNYAQFRQGHEQYFERWYPWSVRISGNGCEIFLWYLQLMKLPSNDREYDVAFLLQIEFLFLISLDWSVKQFAPLFFLRAKIFFDNMRCMYICFFFVRYDVYSISLNIEWQEIMECACRILSDC